MSAIRSPVQQLDCYLRQIAAGGRSGGLLEIRFALCRGEMGRMFLAARRLDVAARVIRSLAPRTDVYCGALLRTRRAGGRDAVGAARLAWVEIDASDALDRLARFRTPTMIVMSGSPGHAHAYFALRAPVEAAELEQANRTLARHLEGDPASVDASRILRPAGTISHKRQPPAAVELAHLDPAACYELRELLDGLQPPTPRCAAAIGVRHTVRGRLDQQLLAIPAATYVRELTGLEPRRNGKVTCPFHDDHDPSLQLYQDGTFYCYGCGAGGSIYDFAGRLWRVDTKGRAFLELRARLADALGLRPAAST